MEFKKNPLSELTDKLETQNSALSRARHAFLTAEAERKHFEAVLIQSAPGKSHAERSINAQATKEWLDFHVKLARLESIFEFQKLKYEVLDREFLAQHLAMKLDSRTIERG